MLGHELAEIEAIKQEFLARGAILAMQDYLEELRLRCDHRNPDGSYPHQELGKDWTYCTICGQVMQWGYDR